MKIALFLVIYLIVSSRAFSLVNKDRARLESLKPNKKGNIYAARPFSETGKINGPLVNVFENTKYYTTNGFEWILDMIIPVYKSHFCIKDKLN